MTSAPYSRTDSPLALGRFQALAAYIETILTDTLAPDTRQLAVAISGGADSMAMLHLAQPWAQAHGIALIALTVDHGLRPEAAAEARQVAHWAAALGIVHHTLTPPALIATANVQHAARQLRYQALTRWCHAQRIGYLLTGHHADDQAETVALQQHRGASPPSRAGMALVSEHDGIRLLRPLLGVRKAMLVNYLNAQGQAWIEDPSNHSDRYARNRLRRTMDDAQVMALWHAAQAQGAIRHADDTARRDWALTNIQAIAGHGLQWPLAPWRALPDTMRTDVLSRAVQAVGQRPYRPRHHETARLDARLREAAAGKATLGHCLLAWKTDGLLTLRPEPARAGGLDMPPNPSHMAKADPLKQLAGMPFWWFNYSPF